MSEFKTFQGISAAKREVPRPNKQDWAKSYACVIVAQCRGVPVVLDYVGREADDEIEYMGRYGDDLQLCPPDDGLWLWEGEFVQCRVSYEYDGEYETVPEGTWRLLTSLELVKLRSGRPIWDADSWFTPEYLAFVQQSAKREEVEEAP